VDGWEDAKVGRFEVEEYFHEFFFFCMFRRPVTWLTGQVGSFTDEVFRKVCFSIRRLYYCLSITLGLCITRIHNYKPV
jgi:hypothetical protein